MYRAAKFRNCPFHLSKDLKWVEPNKYHYLTARILRECLSMALTVTDSNSKCGLEEVLKKATAKKETNM